MTKQTESNRFRDFAKQVIFVPKTEIDRRDAAWKKARKAKKS